MRLSHPALFVILALCSCGAPQRIYFADRAAHFGFREKGEAKAIASIKPQSNSTDATGTVYRGAGSSFGADVGYAATGHLLAFGSYRGVNDLYAGDERFNNGTYNGRRVEGGAGYFGGFGGRGIAEALAGFGAGTLQRRGEGSNLRDFRADYRRYFLQGALGFHICEAFALSGGLRFAVQHYYRFDSPDPELRYIIGQQDAGTTVYTDITQRPLGLMEPFVNIEAGYKWAKFNLQSGFSTRYSGPRIGGTIPAYLHLGLVAHWAPRYRGSKGNKAGSGE